MTQIPFSTFLLTLALLSFIWLVFGDSEFLDNLKSCVSKTKQALTEKQLEDINNIRTRISQFDGVRFDEPIFKVRDYHFEIALREYLFSMKRTIDRTKEGDQAKLEKRIREACKVVNEIWVPLFADYYLKKSLKLILFEDLKNGPKDDYEMLLNAGVCYNGFNRS